MNTDKPLDRRGLAAAISAYVLWGVFPLYWVMLKAVPAMQIIAHRVVWCGVFVVAYLMWIEGRGWLRRSVACGQDAGWSTACATSPHLRIT